MDECTEMTCARKEGHQIGDFGCSYELCLRHPDEEGVVHGRDEPCPECEHYYDDPEGPKISLHDLTDPLARAYWESEPNE